MALISRPISASVSIVVGVLAFRREQPGVGERLRDGAANTRSIDSSSSSKAFSSLLSRLSAPSTLFWWRSGTTSVDCAPGATLM